MIEFITLGHLETPLQLVDWVLIIAHELMIFNRGGSLHLLDFIREICRRITLSIMEVCRWTSELIERLPQEFLQQQSYRLFSLHRHLLQLQVLLDFDQHIIRITTPFYRCLLKIKLIGSCLRKRRSVICNSPKFKRWGISPIIKNMEHWVARKMGRCQTLHYSWTILKNLRTF